MFLRFRALGEGSVRGYELGYEKRLKLVEGHRWQGGKDQADRVGKCKKKNCTYTQVQKRSVMNP